MYTFLSKKKKTPYKNMVTFHYIRNAEMFLINAYYKRTTLHTRMVK